MTAPLYAIGDIHGQIQELERVLTWIERDGGPDAKVIFLGDYTDRGPNSKDVLDLLITGKAAARNWVFLKGNHDRMFEWFMRDYPKHDAYLPVEFSWLHPRLGGDTTLASYGIEVTLRSRQLEVHAQAKQLVPAAHIDFIRDLPLSHNSEHVFFAHAGIRPDVALSSQDEEDLLWIRKEFHVVSDPHPKLIVHGHTPVKIATHYGNRINLDTGAGYGSPLTVAVFEGINCWLLTETGRQTLTPLSSTK